ncbi:neuroglobin [Biomphalaria glabrata]|nr:neuroglobin [Biomphalaria glabrata]
MGCLFSHIGPYKEKCLISSNGVQCREEDDQEGSDGSCAGYAAVGISYKQGFSLKQSWKGIKRKMEDTGVEMFVRYRRFVSLWQIAINSSICVVVLGYRREEVLIRFFIFVF